MGASWETIAFSFHALGSHDQQMVAYATVYQLLFLLAPLWINAFVYMTFGRMVYYFLPDKKIAVIKATSLSRYFVIADIVSFLVQATGGIMASPGAGQSIIKIGLRVYEGGIGLQESFIVAFLMLMLLFRRRRLQNESCRSRDDAQTHTTGQEPQTRWRSLFYTLLATLVCISVSGVQVCLLPLRLLMIAQTTYHGQIRIFYRLAEWARGFSPVHNPVPFHEAYSYALDAFPMIGALLLLALYHPGRVLQGKHSEFPKKTRKQKKADKEARREARKKTKRPGVEAAL